MVGGLLLVGWAIVSRGGLLCVGCAGGTVVVHVSFTTVTWVRFRLRAATRLKLSLSHVRRVLSSLTLPSIGAFLRILRFPTVVTLES